MLVSPHSWPFASRRTGGALPHTQVPVQRADARGLRVGNVVTTGLVVRVPASRDEEHRHRAPKLPGSHPLRRCSCRCASAWPGRRQCSGDLPVPDPVHDRPTGRSDELFDRARAVTPGGVNSPVRAFDAVGGTPRFIASARGAWLTDVDGNEYVDLVCSWGPMLLGHAHPEVQAAVAERGGPRHVVRHPDRARGRARRGDRAPVRRSSRSASSPPAPRPPCRRSGWPAGSPAATSW